MSAHTQGGASISARTLSQSINLQLAADLLLKVLAPKDQDQAPPDICTWRTKPGQLVLHTPLILKALFSQKDFLDIGIGDSTGLICDYADPPKYTTVRMGGVLHADTRHTTHKSIDKLQGVIESLVDEALPASELPHFTRLSAAQCLDRLSIQLDVKVPPPSDETNVVPMSFTSSERSREQRSSDLARLLYAIEEVSTSNWLDDMLKGMNGMLSKDGNTEEEIEPILEAVRQQAEQPGSQMRRFLDFLEDEVLARVRLMVSLRLMQSVASKTPDTALKAYVANVSEIIERFVEKSDQALMLDASLVFGLRSVTNLGDHAKKKMFYGCLPVWPEGGAQLFEDLVSSDKTFPTVREVSYRFRVNGPNPQKEGKSAYKVRLERLAADLTSPAPHAKPDASVGRRLSELVFLWLVIPAATNFDKRSLMEKAEWVSQALPKDPQATIALLLEDLNARSHVVDKIATALIAVLREKSHTIVDETRRQVELFHVVVKKSIIDRAALTTMQTRNTQVLKTGEDTHDHVVWFEHIAVVRGQAIAGLAAYDVKMRLSERAIVPAGDTHTLSLTTQRDMPILPVHFMPVHTLKTAIGPKPPTEEELRLAAAFNAGYGVVIEFDRNALRLNDHLKDEKKRIAELKRATATAAFTLLVYLFMWVVGKRVQAHANSTPFAMWMLRLQLGDQKVDNKESDGTTAVYSACQAIERALGREWPVKLQGFNAAGNQATEHFRKTNTLLALHAGLPVTQATSGSLKRIALVSYVTRPADAHPSFPDQTGWLLLSKTFCANVNNEGLMQIVAEKTESRLLEDREDFKDPQVLFKEMARLAAAGYEHIMLLSHHFGNRHIGRAAERHAPHASRVFLDAVQAKFPNLYVYPIRRDVFPATRLRKRLSDESVFEAVGFDEHKQMYELDEVFHRRCYAPVYTLATLNVIEEKSRPQSGFCTYFYDDDITRLGQPWAETLRQNILALTPQGRACRQSLIELLRAVHFMESEKAFVKGKRMPVLDPYGWVNPISNASSGEIQIFSSRSNRNAILSLPAVLAHVTSILHKREKV